MQETQGQIQQDERLASIDLSFIPNALYRPLDLTDFATQINLRVRQDEALRWVRSSARAHESRLSSKQRLKLEPTIDFGEETCTCAGKGPDCGIAVFQVDDDRKAYSALWTRKTGCCMVDAKK